MSNSDKILVVTAAHIEKARSQAEAGANCCGCSGSGEARDLLANILESSPILEIAGYEGSSGFYYCRLAAVENGEQSIKPIYRLKK